MDPSISKAATGLGGGIGRQGSLCGALTGSVIGVSLRFGRTSGDDAQSRDKTYALAGELYRWFMEENGARECRALLGIDISTPEGYAEFRKSGLKDTRCSGFVGKAARKAVELIVENS